MKIIKYRKNIFIIISIWLIFIISSLTYYYFIYNIKYEVKLNLSFNLNTKISWNIISEKYENIINITDTDKKKSKLIKESLGNSSLNIKKVETNLIIDPDVYARQINIKYKTKNKYEGVEIVNEIANNIININNKFMPKEKVDMEKKITISENCIIMDNKINILIFAIWGLLIGISISNIMEVKWKEKK